MNELRSQSKQPPKIQFEAGIPRFVSVQVPITKDASGDPVVRALDFLERYRDLYRIQNPRAQLYLEHSVANETGQHIFFGQRRDDLPVFGAQLAVHLSKDAVIATNGNYLTDIPHFFPPAMDEKRAEAIAVTDMGANAERIGQPKLVYFNRRMFMAPAEITSSELDDKTHQAWRLTVVQNSEGQAYSYFIDAQTGVVLFRLNLSPSHTANKDFDIRSAQNSGPTLFCGYTNGTNWFNKDGVLQGATPSVEGTKAFGFAQQIYDFFYNNVTPHRHSWDGNDDTIRLYLDDGSDPENAHFEPACKHFVFGKNMATLDVVAHEITHGITSTSAGGGLIYSNQPGALNESYSDVFAAMIDRNWTIGEGLLPRTANTPGIALPVIVRTCSLPLPEGTLRDMSNPPACDADLDGVGDPDKMSTFIRRGVVHSNSGIPNKVAFLITAGGTHNGITVRGIGWEKTTQLYYEVLTSWITSNANFDSARNVTVEVAQRAAVTGSYGFTSDDACVVVNAFASVGLGLSDLDCDGVDDNGDTDDDGDMIGDSADNCTKVSNPGQADIDFDKIGDACDSDGDIDLDGVLDSVDNCLLHKNPLQENNFDTDLIGDACDEDLDNDTICNTVGPNFFGILGPPCPKPDNCPIVKNSTQDDSDKDGYGDACDSCPTATNTGIDTDLDGMDKACDVDDDKDRILDGNDNCPTVANHDQKDFNGNGIGTACDPSEQPTLGTSPHEKIVGAIQFRRDRFDRFQILIRPDICTDRDCIPINLFAEVKVQLEIDLPMRIVDDQGFVVAQSQPGLEKVLRFIPKPDFFYWPPGTHRSVGGLASDAIKPYQGRQYFLEIFPSREVDPGRSYKISIEAIYGNQR